MSIRAGHYAQLLLTNVGAGGGTLPDVIELFELKVRRVREFVDVTPPDETFKQHWPSHELVLLRYRGWIDSDNNPGDWDIGAGEVLPYKAVLRPDRTDVNKNLTFNCWHRLLEWTLGVGAPNITGGELISDDPATFVWT